NRSAAMISGPPRPAPAAMATTAPNPIAIIATDSRRLRRSSRLIRSDMALMMALSMMPHPGSCFILVVWSCFVKMGGWPGHVLHEGSTVVGRPPRGNTGLASKPLGPLLAEDGLVLGAVGEDGEVAAEHLVGAVEAVADAFGRVVGVVGVLGGVVVDGDDV